MRFGISPSKLGIVVPPPLVLGALSFSATSFTVGAAASGAINGATALSTITATGLPAGLTINGAARTWAWDGTGTASTGSFTLTETLAGAVGSPKPTTISYTIAAASGSLSISTAPALSGDAVVGQTIFATNGTYSAIPDSYTPTWSVGGVVQSDQAGTALLVLDDYAGSAIGYSEIAHKAAYTDSASNAATSTGAVANISLANAITAFTRTSTSGDNSSATGLTFSVTFGSNVYEGYYLHARVYSDSAKTIQIQDVLHTLTHDDLQPAATINLLADGLTKLGPNDWLELTVETDSPNQLPYNFVFPTAISPTDASVAMTLSPTNMHSATSIALSNGNLTASVGSGQNAVLGSRSVSATQPTYWEVNSSGTSGNTAQTVGVADIGVDLTVLWGSTVDGLTATAHAGVWTGTVGNGEESYNNSRTDIGFWVYTNVAQIAWDPVHKKLFFGKDNTWLNGTPNISGTGGLDCTGIGSPQYPAFQVQSSRAMTVNFGTTPGGTTGFAFTPPTGFVAP